MLPANLPHFLVLDVREDCCCGKFEASRWVGENWTTVLFLGADRFLWGRFREVNVGAQTCKFYPDQISDMATLSKNSSYPFMDGYWGERAELVLNEGLYWKRVRFEPSDMVRFPSVGGGWMGCREAPNAPPGGKVLTGGWDHEHCNICQKKIGFGGYPTGFFSPPDKWVCVDCYENFVATRSLAFCR
jgi:hypothetical protein